MGLTLQTNSNTHRIAMAADRAQMDESMIQFERTREFYVWPPDFGPDDSPGSFAPPPLEFIEHGNEVLLTDSRDQSGRDATARRCRYLA